MVVGDVVLLSFGQPAQGQRLGLELSQVIVKVHDLRFVLRADLPEAIRHSSGKPWRVDLIRTAGESQMEWRMSTAPQVVSLFDMRVKEEHGIQPRSWTLDRNEGSLASLQPLRIVVRGPKGARCKLSSRSCRYGSGTLILPNLSLIRRRRTFE